MTFRQEGKLGWILIVSQMIGWFLTIAALIRGIGEDSKRLGLVSRSNGTGPYSLTPHDSIIHRRVQIKPESSDDTALGRSQ